MSHPPELAPPLTAPPTSSRWTYAYFSNPSRLVVSTASISGHASIQLLCQPNPRWAEFRIDPATNDPNAVEGAKSVFLIEIQDASRNVRKFPMVAYNMGPDGGSQFYSRNFLSTPFLDAFGQEGGVLSWRTQNGAETASWPLSGTVEARGMVRKICHL